MYNVTLEQGDIDKAKSFATEFINAERGKSKKDFGSTSVPERNKNDMLADTISGKLGEIVFQKFCNTIGVTIDVDFNISPGYANNDDGQDVLLVNGERPLFKFDIKEAKNYANWLLVESHKMSKDVIEADVYILVLMFAPRNIESNPNFFDGASHIKAHIPGYAYRQDFFGDDNEILFRFKKDKQLARQKSIQNFIDSAQFNNKQYTREAIVKSYLKNKDRIEFLNIKQKADLNYGLPIFLLRKDRAELKDILTSKNNTLPIRKNIIEIYLDKKK